MGAPLIGVTTSVTVDASPERAYVNASYLRAVQAAGGIPVLLPPQLEACALDDLWRRVAGVLLTGGGDIDPARFDERRHGAVSEVAPARDALEIEVVERALHDRIPMLAVCRGIQVLNVARGGSLHQDIASDVPRALAHAQKAPRDQPTHAVSVRGETRVAAVLGASDVAVNSMHHQAIKRLGRGLADVGWAPDGIIEAVEMPDARAVVIGVQWHPEELVARDAAARRLFATLVEAARSR